MTTTPIPIRVDNRIRIALVDLPGRVAERLRVSFTHENPNKFMLRKIELHWAAKAEPSEYATYLERDGEISFPRGGMARVRAVLGVEGVGWVEHDCREPGRGPKDIPPYGRELWRHQREMIDRGRPREQGMLLCPTGSGKTSTIIAMAAELDTPSLVLVHASGLLRQWRRRASVELGLPLGDIGIVGGGKCDVQPLTVGLVKSVRKHALADEEFRHYWGAVFADEVQFFASDSLYGAIDILPARYRFGTSADHRRKDRKEFLITDIFGDVLSEHTREELERSGVIVPVVTRIIETDFRAPWYGLGKSDDGSPSFTNDGERVHVDFDRLLKLIAVNGNRNAKIVSAVGDEYRSGATVVVLTERRDHVYTLAAEFARQGMPSGTLVGDDAENFELSKSKLQQGKLRVGVGTYKAFGTGIDIPSLGVIVGASPIAANRQLFNQVKGRPCRSSDGKTSGKFYYVLDSNVFPYHFKNVRAWSSVVEILEHGIWTSVEKRKRKNHA